MTDTRHDAIAERRQAILDTLAQAAPGRTVTLVAVSKRQPDDRIEAALAEGQRVFGENRVQEAQARWTDRRSRWPGLELRLVGPLQSNKAEDAVALFDVIETVDRPKIVKALASAMDKLDRRPACLVQVNTGEEPQKAGIAPADLPGLLDTARASGLPVSGLMCIPPVDEPAGPHFALLAELAAGHGLTTLSMGMSADYELAARYGATHVRVGSALFGEREA
mgnify:CR=1 FL=1